MSLYQKYNVSKVNGSSDPNAKYIVLRYDALSKDVKARSALLHYCQLHQDKLGQFTEPFFQELWDDVVSESIKRSLTILRESGKREPS